MFSQLKQLPADPILGLSVKFKADSNPNKIDLGAGIYKDAFGNTPVLDCVKIAEQFRVDNEASKAYLGSTGSPLFNTKMTELILGDHSVIRENRIRTVSTPGGTGALRVAGEFIKKCTPGATIWVSNPTWANHQSVFQSVGLEVGSYAYYNADNKSLDFEALLASLSQVPEGDVVLFHGCCHNPTGIDPTPEQWYQLAKLCSKQGFLPLFDFAYQGFGQGLQEDAQGLRTFLEHVPEMLIASSFSKNFGLYNERVGALTILCETAEQAETAFTQIKRCIRTNYSNPPSHGSAVVAEILNDPELFALWESEVKAMRTRIHEMRSLFVNTLRIKGVSQDFSFISQQQGMFSFSGLTPDQVAQLRKEFGIYIVGSGRISVAGMTHDNMEPLCDAIANILKG